MKKPLGAVLGLTAACAACCAILLAVPTILAVAGITSAWLGAHVVGTAIAATAALSEMEPGGAPCSLSPHQ